MMMLITTLITMKITITITGLAKPPTFTSPDTSLHRDSYSLAWSTERWVLYFLNLNVMNNLFGVVCPPQKGWTWQKILFSIAWNLCWLYIELRWLRIESPNFQPLAGLLLQSVLQEGDLTHVDHHGGGFHQHNHWHLIIHTFWPELIFFYLTPSLAIHIQYLLLKPN